MTRTADPSASPAGFPEPIPTMRSRILHLADLHLGDLHAYLGPAAAARRMEADGLLRRIADFVLSPDSGIGGVIVAGDLFDLPEPSPRWSTRCWRIWDGCGREASGS